MSKGNTTENDVLALIFNKTLAAHLGVLDTTGNANVYIGLHTADPTETGDQTSSEATYGNYGRIAGARTVGGWTVSGNQAKNAALIQFATCNGGTNTITHVVIGTVASAGAGQILDPAHSTTTSPCRTASSRSSRRRRSWLRKTDVRLLRVRLPRYRRGRRCHATCDHDAPVTASASVTLHGKGGVKA